jgi:glycosyltransferase involved in cell wall biosynthesis
MRVLWLSHFIPYPPIGGNRQRSFNLIRNVSRRDEVSLIAFNLLNEPDKQLVDYQIELKKYCASVEFWSMPLRWRSIQWWAKSAVSPLLHDPFASRAFWSKRVAERWKNALLGHIGAVLHIDSPDLALFTDLATNFSKVLNHHNCESAMADRRAQLDQNAIRRFYLRAQAHKLNELEQRICPRFDVNTVVSESDALLLRARAPNAHFHVVENGTDLTYFQTSHLPIEPKSLIFAGSMNWYGNISAVQYFASEVFPLIQKECKDAHLYLAGNSPPKWVLEWAAQNGSVTVVPSPADIRPWLDRAAVFVCPIFDGGGTRLKILDAMAMGKAVVSTSIGCEGLRVKNGENIMVADGPKEFASAVLCLLENDALRLQIGAAGRVLVEKEYSWERISLELQQAYRCALNREACELRAMT